MDHPIVAQIKCDARLSCEMPQHRMLKAEGFKKMNKRVNEVWLRAGKYKGIISD